MSLVCLKCATIHRACFIDGRQRVFSGDHSPECKEITKEDLKPVEKTAWQRFKTLLSLLFRVKASQIPPEEQKEYKNENKVNNELDFNW